MRVGYKESWVPKNWCFWTMALEKTLECPLDCKEIKPGNPKGNLSWIFIGRTDAEAEALIFWPPDVKNWLIGKDPDAGKNWRWEEKGTTEDEMVGWHHRLNGYGFGWTPGVGDGQGGLECCGSWDGKESDMTEGLNWTVNDIIVSQQWHHGKDHLNPLKPLLNTTSSYILPQLSQIRISDSGSRPWTDLMTNTEIILMHTHVGISPLQCLQQEYQLSSSFLHNRSKLLVSDSPVLRGWPWKVWRTHTN